MNFPKFMIRQTGGLAVGAISTRSSAASFAFWSASPIGTMPSGSPSAPIRRTSFHRICSLIRMLFLSIFHLRRELPAPRRNGASRGAHEFVHTHRSSVAAVAQAHSDRARRRLLFPDHQHARDLMQLGLPDARSELFVPLVRFD